jgi:uncharacterized protein YutE (UPF0331/DUF86 family)
VSEYKKSISEEWTNFTHRNIDQALVDYRDRCKNFHQVLLTAKLDAGLEMILEEQTKIENPSLYRQIFDLLGEAGVFVNDEMDGLVEALANAATDALEEAQRQ